MRPAARTLAFVLANTLAVLVALYLAFASDLERPYWAMFTVFVIAKPIAGAVRSKAVFRLIGTLAGAGLSLFLIPPLVQAPVLLCLATSLWVGLCVYLALQDRRPRNYAFLLAGYTTTIVGLAVVNSPETIFDTSVSRVEEISLGLVCAAVAHSVFFPQSILDELLERADRALRKSAAWFAEAISRPADTADIEAQAQLAAFVSDLHLLYDHIAFETSDVPRQAGLMLALQERFALFLPLVSSLQQAIASLSAENQLTPSVQAVITGAARWARRLARSDSSTAQLRELSADLHLACARLEAEISPSDRWIGALKELLVVQLPRVLAELSQASQILAALEGKPADAAAVRALSADRPRRSLYRDRGLALLSAVAATTATLVACVLWIEGSWPEGGVAAQFAAIGCSLFATLDRPSKVIFSAVIGIVVALPLAALYQFAIFPRIDGFPSLALVLLPPVLLFSWMQSSERLEGPALVMAIAFSGGLALGSSYQPNFAAFANSNLAEIAGLLIAAITNLIFRTIDPLWNAVRISRSGWRSLRDLARRPESDGRAWVLEMFDRLGLVNARLLAANRRDLIGARLDVLRDMRIGIHLVDLQLACRLLGEQLHVTLDPVRTAVAGACQRLIRGHSLPDPRCIQVIDRGITALVNEPPLGPNQSAMRALVALRLDLAGSASRYQGVPS